MMTWQPGDGHAKGVPPRRDRHYSYDECSDKPAKLLDDQPAEIQRQTPAYDNDHVERAGEADKPMPSPFDD